MKKSIQMKNASLGLALCGVLLIQPVFLSAQEAPMPPGGQMGAPGTPGAEGKEKFRDMMNEMQQRRQQMEQERQATFQELRRQLAALQAHTKTMTSLTDDKQFIAEMKKHQQMSDTLLGALVDQQEKMGRPRDRRPGMPGGMGGKMEEGGKGFFGRGKDE
ncbi:MAG: hypothetical protein HYZ50_19490 [Deltaproteobacteria bacterium]|nr:hypothetical protein [Deltaproteobacteria bacterium]